jgi:GTP:adenosylcobinamide-phosphate guanylyltransferase
MRKQYNSFLLDIIIMWFWGSSRRNSQKKKKSFNCCKDPLLQKLEKMQKELDEIAVLLRPTQNASEKLTERTRLVNKSIT